MPAKVQNKTGEQRRAATAKSFCALNGQVPLWRKHWLAVTARFEMTKMSLNGHVPGRMHWQNSTVVESVMAAISQRKLGPPGKLPPDHPQHSPRRREQRALPLFPADRYADLKISKKKAMVKQTAAIRRTGAMRFSRQTGHIN